MALNPDAVGAPPSPWSGRGTARTPCSTPWAWGRARSTRRGSSSTSPRRTPTGVTQRGPADLHHHRRAGRRARACRSGTSTRPCSSTASRPSGCTARCPPQGTVSITTTVAGMYDKGAAGLVVLESESRHAASGEPAFTTRTALFIRGAGGFGGPRNPEGDAESDAGRRAAAGARARRGGLLRHRARTRRCSTG